MQVEALLNFNEQIKNVEAERQVMSKLKGTLDQKQKALDAVEGRQQQAEELLRKEQSEWKAIHTKRQ